MEGVVLKYKEIGGTNLLCRPFSQYLGYCAFVFLDDLFKGPLPQFLTCHPADPNERTISTQSCHGCPLEGEMRREIGLSLDEDIAIPAGTTLTKIAESGGLTAFPVLPDNSEI